MKREGLNKRGGEDQPFYCSKKKWKNNVLHKKFEGMEYFFFLDNNEQVQCNLDLVTPNLMQSDLVTNRDYFAEDIF